jgi:hypothetical protein
MADFRAKANEIDSKFNHQDIVVNGIKWHYVDQGPKDGTVIVFLHGLPEGWYSWRYVLPLIDPKYRLIAPDMKGYGRSDKEDSNYNWHVVARQAVEFVNSLGRSSTVRKRNCSSQRAYGRRFRVVSRRSIQLDDVAGDRLRRT